MRRTSNGEIRIQLRSIEVVDNIKYEAEHRNNGVHQIVELHSRV